MLYKTIYSLYLVCLCLLYGGIGGHQTLLHQIAHQTAEPAENKLTAEQVALVCTIVYLRFT